MINMKKVNYAAIDIGSNAVRLLIKCVNEENAYMRDYIYDQGVLTELRFDRVC